MKIFKKYWKWYFLPSPSKLGLTTSEHEGLAWGSLASPGEPTWDDWENIVKKKHPIRYFLVEGMFPGIQKAYRKIVSDPIYWFKCHFISKYKYHLLDLRQPKTETDPGYQYGWIDCDTRMVYAIFNILNMFVEYEMKNRYCPSEEDVQADPYLLVQRNHTLEIKNIHYWWNVERLRQEKIYSDMLKAWSDAKQNYDSGSQELWKKLNDLDEANKEKEEEMLARLLKIRHSLWT